MSYDKWKADQTHHISTGEQEYNISGRVLWKNI